MHRFLEVTIQEVVVKYESLSILWMNWSLLIWPISDRSSDSLVEPSLLAPFRNEWGSIVNVVSRSHVWTPRSLTRWLKLHRNRFSNVIPKTYPCKLKFSKNPIMQPWAMPLESCKITARLWFRAWLIDWFVLECVPRQLRVAYWVRVPWVNEMFPLMMWVNKPLMIYSRIYRIVPVSIDIFKIKCDDADIDLQCSKLFSSF